MHKVLVIPAEKMQELNKMLFNNLFNLYNHSDYVPLDRIAKQLQKIFEQERDDALNNMGKILQQNSWYFIINPDGLNEVIAETYAILSGLDYNNVESNLGIRTNILMQYFPNTIAYIANKLFL